MTRSTSPGERRTRMSDANIGTRDACVVVGGGMTEVFGLRSLACTAPLPRAEESYCFGAEAGVGAEAAATGAEAASGVACAFAWFVWCFTLRFAFLCFLTGAFSTF